jgi:hypothetical protein
LVGFYPLEFDDDGKATDVAGQVSEPEGGHLWLQHLEDMKDDGDADQYVYNAEKLLGIAKDLWSEYPESVMDWSQVPDSSVVPTILKLIVKLPNNGSTSSFPPFSFPPGESADGGSGCKVTQRATRANASSTPARGGSCSRTTAIVPRDPVVGDTLTSPAAAAPSRKRKTPEVHVKQQKSTPKQQKSTPTVDYPMMAGAEEVTSDQHDLNKAKVLNLEADHKHCATLVYVVHMMRKLLVKQGLTNGMILSLYDISFQFASGPTPFHTDDTNGDGPGRYIMNTNLAGVGLLLWKGDPAGDSFFNPRGVLVGPGDITTMGGEYRHTRVHEVLRLEEKHSPMVVDAPWLTNNVRCVMTCRFGKPGKSKTQAGLWNHRESKVLAAPFLPSSLPLSHCLSNVLRHTDTHTHTNSHTHTHTHTTFAVHRYGPAKRACSAVARFQACPGRVGGAVGVAQRGAGRACGPIGPGAEALVTNRSREAGVTTAAFTAAFTRACCEEKEEVACK